MTVEREILETDILIVGAGPAGLATAIKLAQLVADDGTVEMPEILVMDKGSYPGAHSLSGAVMDPKGLAELIPDFQEKGAPLESPVTSDAFYYLTESSMIKSPIVPPPVKNDGKFIVSLNKLAGWMAEQAEALGIDVYSGLAGYDLLVEDGRVTGVQTVDMGLDKEGNQKGNYEPGSLIKAKVTILCEGVHGSLTRHAFEKIPELTAHCQPQSYLTGVKEVWEVPEGRIKAGEVIHSVGWPATGTDYGGAWIYGMSDRMVSIGYAVGLDSANPELDPHLMFQQYKTHKLVRGILEGGTMLHYGAKALPDAGYFSIPKLYHDGLMLAGDSAGLLNPQKLKGVHLAIKSGIMVAETLFDCARDSNYSVQKLAAYASRFENSWARQELYATRNFHAGFKGGLLMGMVHAGLQILTGGAGLFDRRDHKADHEYMKMKAHYQSPTQAAAPIKFDNKYLFDKVSDVYKSGTAHEENEPSHLVISDFDICNSRCTEEYGNPCQHFCPAQVYEMVDDETRPGQQRLMLTPSNCVHCKTCDIRDPYQVIRWVTPQGEEGPNYTNC